MKKRIIIAACVLVVVLVIILAVCCNNDKEDLSNVEYGARTANFYANLNKSSFWFKMTLTENGEECIFTQATNGSVVTTIKDYGSNDKDSYEIFVGNAVHQMDMNSRSFDTVLTEQGQDFIFADYNQSMFVSPYSYGVSTFEGEEYYCEIFTTSVTASGEITGTNKYYFEYDRLVAVEMVENGTTVMTMRFENYSDTIPEDICLSVPEGFTAGELIYEHSAIDYSQYWGDLE